ncbi:lipopolysaccharide biosynthesis protein [Breoghania sp. L-A4]|nr:lipopolysaccharide biosynthesis protein [Breoghania sp. L-A4]
MLRARLSALREGTTDAAGAQRTALFTFTVRIFGAALAYLSQVFLARWMGGHEYGIFVVVWTWIVIVGVIAPLGFNAAVLRLIPEYLEKNQPELLRGVLLGCRAYSVGSAALLAAIGALSVWLLSGEIASYYILPAYLMALCLPLFTLTDVQEGIARANSWSDLAMLPTYIWRPLLILAVMLGASLLDWPHTAVTACVAAIIATWLVGLGQYAAINRRLRRIVAPGPRAWAPRAWLAIALPIFLAEGFFALLTSSDVLMVGYFMPPERVAVYFAAAKTLALVHFVYFAVKAATAHRYSRLHHAGDRAGLAAFVEASVKWTFWPSLAGTLFLLAFGKYILLMFGKDFADGQLLLSILLIGVLARAAIGPVDALLTMAGEQKRCAMAYLAAFVCNLTLNLTLIPLYGLEGAAIATAAAMVIEAALLFSITRRHLGLYTFIWRPAGVALDTRAEAAHG